MVKRKQYFIAFLTLVLFIIGGCSKPETIYIDKPIYVNVPVLKIPKIKPVQRPILDTKKLTKESLPAEVVAAYYSSLKNMIRYAKLLELRLEPFYKEYQNDRSKYNKSNP